MFYHKVNEKGNENIRKKETSAKLTGDWQGKYSVVEALSW